MEELHKVLVSRSLSVLEIGGAYFSALEGMIENADHIVMLIVPGACVLLAPKPEGSAPDGIFRCRSPAALVGGRLVRAARSSQNETH